MTALPLARAPWQSRFVDRLPADPETENFVRPVRDATHSLVAPTPVSEPRLVGWSGSLAAALGISRPGGDDSETLELLAGNRILPGMRPFAARYGGHQFGHWAGQLGDGRAITLGEIPAGGPGLFGLPDGGAATRYSVELQLKGAGPTPYSRRADGRAVLRSSVREFLCSEAMHFLGVPTTRALSLVATGDPVIRDIFYSGDPKPEPGAIVCRVAPSFLRFGNFQILASQGEHELLAALTDLLIADHFPELGAPGKETYGALLDEIARRTARMVSEWTRVGFVHGVMNTDNMSALGLTIDYGPYGWLEPFDPDWTPNTTDAEGRRYRFGHQPSIAAWNLARLAEAWLPLLRDEARAYAGLEVFKRTLEDAQDRMLREKFGLSSVQGEVDAKLVEDAFRLLSTVETDYTLFFRALTDWRPDGDFLEALRPALYPGPGELATPIADDWRAWSKRYADRIAADGLGSAERSRLMRRANPKYVLRNYLAQRAIDDAAAGDPTRLERLLRVLETPYDDHPGDEDLAERRPEWARNRPGCSALSCSS